MASDVLVDLLRALFGVMRANPPAGGPGEPAVPGINFDPSTDAPLSVQGPLGVVTPWGGGTDGVDLTPDVVASTTYALVPADRGKNKVFTNAAGCTVTVNTGLGVGFFCFISKSAGAGTLTVAGTATVTSDSGSTSVSANSAVCLLVPTNTDVYDLQGPTGPALGSTIDLNPVDITSSRALTAADFGTGIIRVNAAGVIAVTVPTVASMGLAATAGRVRTLIFEVIGTGVPTWAGATSSTSLNGTAGTATVLPGSVAGTGGSAPTQYQYVVLTQTTVGSDAWSLQ